VGLSCAEVCQARKAKRAMSAAQRRRGRIRSENGTGWEEGRLRERSIGYRVVGEGRGIKREARIQMMRIRITIKIRIMN
jgi:hypothetical protein